MHFRGAGDCVYGTIPRYIKKELQRHLAAAKKCLRHVYTLIMFTRDLGLRTGSHRLGAGAIGIPRGFGSAGFDVCTGYSSDSPLTGATAVDCCWIWIGFGFCTSDHTISCAPTPVV
ncbi:MAG: hypothetical protein WA824_05880 [Candidatus Sulfotelmatobacter sp.]